MSQKEKPINLFFDTNARTIIEVYEISPDGGQMRTVSGWISAYVEDVIRMRGLPGREFMDDSQVEFAIQSEKDLLKEKKYKDTGAYLVAKKYPIARWLKGE